MIDEISVMKVEWMITRRCQFKCSYCRIRDKRTLKGVEQSTEEVLKGVRVIRDRFPGAAIVFFGGEPTLRDDLPDIIRYCEDIDQKYAIISNSVRLLNDDNYRRRLMEAGLSNWTVSIDGMDRSQTVDDYTYHRVSNGLKALRILRDDYGVRDLVASATVTRKSIERIPDMVEAMTKEGIWSIICMLQIAKPGHEYSQGSVNDLPTPEQARLIAPILSEMARSERYLMHNEGAWFDRWLTDDIQRQDWVCNGKAGITIDADGSLKYCVEVPFSQKDRMFISDLATDSGWEKYNDVFRRGVTCSGCVWDTAYEMIRRANETLGEVEGRRSFRHEISSQRLMKLLPEARHWFEGNPTLRRVK